MQQYSTIFKVYVSSSSGAIPLTTSVFQRGNLKVPVLVTNIFCLSGAATLQDCYYEGTISISTSTSFSYYNSAVSGIICQGNATSETECIPGDTKLVGGSKVNEGRIEVCIDGFWGTVCDEGWDDDDASVICRQLGLSATGNYTTRYYITITVYEVLFVLAGNPALGFGEGRGPVISHLSCTSRESNISQCGWRIGTTDCHHGRDVAITCEGIHELVCSIYCPLIRSCSIFLNVFRIE